MIKEFGKDLIKYAPSKIIPGIFGVIMIPVLTRILNPDEYGKYIIVISAILVLNIIAVDWINTSLIRFHAKHEKQSELELFYGTIIRLTGFSAVVISLIAYLVLVILKDYFDETSYYYYNIGILIFFFGVAFSVMLELLVVKRKANSYSLMSIWRQCGSILIGLSIVLLFDLSADGLLWGRLIAVVVIIPYIFYITFKKIYLKYSKKICVDIIQYGFPLVVTNLAWWVLVLSDRYFIEYFRGSHEVGIYSMSYSLAEEIMTFIVSLMILSSAPIAMKLWETEGVSSTTVFIKELMRYYLIIAMPMAIGLSLLSEPIINFLAAQSFHEGFRIIPLVAISIFLNGLQRNFQLGLLFYKKTNLVMLILLISGIINVILNIYFIPKYGFIAAGYTTLLSYIVFTFLTIYISRKYFVFNFPYNTLMRVLFSLAVMSIAVLSVSAIKTTSVLLYLVISVILGAIVYFICLFLSKEINKATLKDIARSFNKK